jgi:hypothetical protein
MFKEVRRNIIRAQLVKRFSAFDKIQTFISVFTKTLFWTVNVAVKSTPHLHSLFIKHHFNIILTVVSQSIK